MQVTETAIAEVRILIPRRFEDERGFFSETWKQRTLAEAGIEAAFVQDCHSHNRQQGTVRGLHFQSPPFAQDKLIRVVRGAVLDVAVDIRHGSPTFGRHVAVELSADNWRQLWVPRGFAHGFCTLEPETDVIYKVTSFYAPDHDLGVRWDDPDLAIDWPVSPGEALLSAKDQRQPAFTDLPQYFRYEI